MPLELQPERQAFSPDGRWFAYTGRHGRQLPALKVYRVSYKDPASRRVSRKAALQTIRRLLASRPDRLKIISRGRIRSLNLSGSSVTDDDLGLLAALGELRSLNLSRTKITNKGMPAVARLTSLRSLELAQTKVDNGALRPLSKLTRLQRLGLRGTGVTAKGLLMLSKRNLRALDLRETKIGNESLNVIASFSSLRELRLDGTKIKDSPFYLRRLQPLRVLSANHLSDRGMRALRRFPLLTALRISGSFGSRSFARLVGLRRLRYLRIDSGRLKDGDLAILKRFRRLESLHINFGNLPHLSNKSLAPLASVRSLRGLVVIAAGYNITDPALRPLGALRRLRRLRVCMPHMSDDALPFLRKLRNLKDLRIECSVMSDRALGYLAPLKNLRFLAIRTPRPIHGDDLKALRALKRLEIFHLAGPYIFFASLLDRKMKSFLPALRRTRLGYYYVPRYHYPTAKTRRKREVIPAGPVPTLDETKLFLMYRNRYFSRAELLAMEDSYLLGVKRTTELGFLRPLRNLKELRLTLDTVQPGMGSVIAQYKSLQRLWLTVDTEIGSTDLAQFAQVEGLDHLTINKLLQDREMLQIGAMKQLKQLTCFHANISDRGIAGIRRLRNLDELQLNKVSRVSPRGWRNLFTLRKLRALNLNRSAVGDEGLRGIAALNKLIRLDLNRTRVADNGLKEIARMSGLKRLHLNHTAVSDRGVDVLKKLQKLEFLELYKTKVSEAKKAELKKAIPSLVSII